MRVRRSEDEEIAQLRKTWREWWKEKNQGSSVIFLLSKAKHRI